MGALLRDTNELASADAAHMNNGAMLNALRRKLQDDSRALVIPEVSNLVSYANQMMAVKIPSDNVCVRSWQLPCPDGWLLLGTICRAPASYTGSCKHLQELQNLDASKKMKFSEDCMAPWPCLDDKCPYGRAYHGCPRGWIATHGDLCEREGQGRTAPKCSSRYNFKDMSIAQKQELARVCDLEWECLATCEKDYSKQCPEDWQSMGDLCFAPPTYEGVCNFRLNATEALNCLSQKIMFETKCVAPFPCKIWQRQSKQGHNANVHRVIDGAGDGKIQVINTRS